MKPLLSALIATLSLVASAAWADYYTMAGRLVIVSDIRLGPDQKQTLENFGDDGNYFGAYYVLRNSDSGYWLRGYNDLSNVKEVAGRRCTEDYGSASRPCELYAILLPRGLADQTQDAFGLSLKTLEVFLGEYQDSQGEDLFGAFAISGMSHYGYSYNWGDMIEAENSAMEFCESGVNDTLNELTATEAQWFRDRNMHLCTLVDTTRR